MYRASVEFLALASLALVLGWTGHCAASDQSKPPPRRDHVIVIGRSAAPKVPTIDWVVELQPSEFRASKQVAEDDVLRKACDQVAALVKEYHPESDWRPSKRFLKTRLRCTDPQASVVQNTSEIDDKKTQLYTASVHLEFTPAAREELFRIVRLEEARERQWMLAKSLFGILAGLIAVAGYLRINERTSGAYSFLLQIGAVAFVGVAAFVLKMLP
jgi:hypothetical protein